MKNRNVPNILMIVPELVLKFKTKHERNSNN